MSKLRSADWWLGRTPEWQARQGKVQDAGRSMSRLGGKLMVWGLVITVLLVLIVATGGAALLVLLPVGVWLAFRRRNRPQTVADDTPA